MKIGFIGTGHMGGALAKAASQNGSNTLLLANRHPEKAQKLAEIIGGTPCDNLQAASEADYLFLGVKPQMLEGMLIGIEDTLKVCHRLHGRRAVHRAASADARLQRTGHSDHAEYARIRRSRNDSLLLQQ